MPKDISEWMADAACIGKSDIFFGPSREKRIDKRLRERTAIKICNGCVSMYECRNYARKNGELGVWGGETEDQRYANGFLNDPWVARNARARERRAQEKNKDSNSSVNTN